MPYKFHIKKWEDLVTPQAIRKGFIAIALEKNIKGSPFIDEARSLKVLTSQLNNPIQLLNLNEINPALLSAAGVSDKALKVLTEEDKLTAIKEFIDKYLVPAGNDFGDELVYRYLLTKGDALGGIMRNVVGAIGNKKIIRNIISNFSLKGIPFKYYHKESNTWIDGDYTDTTLEENISGLFWEFKKKKRLLVFNCTPPFVKNNVDLCLLDGSYEGFFKSQSKKRVSIHKIPDKYIALGELKGGIDPAGADEHWKTGNSALNRIRKAFRRTSNSKYILYWWCNRK